MRYLHGIDMDVATAGQIPFFKASCRRRTWRIPGASAGTLLYYVYQPMTCSRLNLSVNGTVPMQGAPMKMYSKIRLYMRDKSSFNMLPHATMWAETCVKSG